MRNMERKRDGVIPIYPQPPFLFFLNSNNKVYELKLKEIKHLDWFTKIATFRQTTKPPYQIP